MRSQALCDQITRSRDEQKVLPTRMKSHARCITYLCLTVSLLVSSGSAPGSDDGNVASPSHGRSSQLHVEFTGDRVSVSARSMTVESILDEISRASGLIIHLDGPLGDIIDIEISQLSLREALRPILSHRNYLLNHTDTQLRTVSSNTWRQSKLWVFDSGTDSDEAGTGLEADERIESLILALDDSDEQVRKKAVYALARIGDDQAIAAISSALTDANAEVRMTAAYALGEVGTQSAIWTLAQSVNDEKRKVREAAIEALADIGGEESARAISLALRHNDASTRRTAIQMLTDLDSEAVTD